MDNFEIKGDEVRHGKMLYLHAATQASVDSFDDTPLSETTLYQLHDGSSPISPTTAKTIAQKIKASDGMVFALRLKQDDSCIAYAHLDDIRWQARLAALHIHILKDDYATENIITDAIQTVLQFAFWEANLNRIEMQCIEDNTLLQAALAQLGFTQEGQLRQEAYRDGRYRDILIYSILAREWA